jgi:hypothetical protein
MRPFKFFFFFALAIMLFFWVTKILFFAFMIAGVLAFGAFVLSGIRRLFGFRRHRQYPARYWAEPLDSNRQPYSSEPIAPRFPQRFDGFSEKRTIEIG